MLEGSSVMGETYTMCDPYLFTVAEWLEGDGVDLSRLPRMIDHRNSMSAPRAGPRSFSDPATSPFSSVQPRTRIIKSISAGCSASQEPAGCGARLQGHWQQQLFKNGRALPRRFAGPPRRFGDCPMSECEALVLP